MKTILFSILLFQIAFYSTGQIKKVYGRDFDYRTLSVKDTLSRKDLPRYYVCCTYSDGILTDIEIYQREEWMTKHLQVHTHVVFKNGHIFFIYDPGKERVGSNVNYGLPFRKYTKETDTAFLANDTLIFKYTTKYRVMLRYITSIFSDSVSVESKIFPITKEEQKKNSKFSFKNYTYWPKDTGYKIFYRLAVTFGRNEVVRAKRMIDDGKIDYSYYHSYDQQSFRHSEIPISLFWIVNLWMLV